MRALVGLKNLRGSRRSIKKKYLCVIFSVIFALSSCTSTNDSLDKKGNRKRIAENQENRTNENLDKDLSEYEIKPAKVHKNKLLSKKLIDSVSEQKENNKNEVSEKPFYDCFLKKGKNSDKPNDVNIVFDAAPIADVIPIFAKLLGFNYYIDPKVIGDVTMSINAELSQHELWELFQQILYLTGSYCSLDDKLVNILPLNKIAKERYLLSDKCHEASICVANFQLKNTKSTEILEQIKPFLTDGAVVMNIDNQNALLVVDTSTNIIKLRTIINKLDVKNKYNWPREIIGCNNVPVNKVVEELTSILPILGFPVSVDSSSSESGAIQLQAIERLQLVIATAANDEALMELKKWMRILDRADIGEQEQVYVYNIENAKAGELVNALSVIFNIDGDTLEPNSSSSISSTDGANSFKSESAKVSSIDSNNDSSSSVKSKTGPSGLDGSPVSVFEVPVKLFADAVNNRFIFRTTPRTFAMIKALLDRIDSVPSQVLLEVIIAEIQLTSGMNFGVEFQQQVSSAGVMQTIGTDFPSLKPGTGKDAGFQYTISGGNTDLYLRALAQKGNTKLLARPQILVESHTEALVSVGEEIPLVTNELTNTQSVSDKDTTFTKNYEYRDTGVILKIKPHVTKGGLITAEINQIVSSPIATTSSSIDSPTIRIRQLMTTLSFPNKCSIIIGGLIQNNSSVAQATLPFIGNIPLLAELFGSNDISKDRTELLLLIKGTIINKQTKLEELIEDYQRAVEYLDEMESEDNIHDNIVLKNENVNNIFIK